MVLQLLNWAQTIMPKWRLGRVVQIASVSWKWLQITLSFVYLCIAYIVVSRTLWCTLYLHNCPSATVTCAWCDIWTQPLLWGHLVYIHRQVWPVQYIHVCRENPCCEASCIRPPLMSMATLFGPKVIWSGVFKFLCIILPLVLRADYNGCRKS